MPPIAIYIRPLSVQPYASATHTFRSSPPARPPLSLRTQPLASTSYPPPISLQPSLYAVSLSAAFHLRGLNPSSHHHSPPPLRFCHRSAMLSDSVLVLRGSERGGRTREWLVGDSRHRFFYEEACIWHYCKRGASLRRFSSFSFFFFPGVGGLAFVGYANSESPRRQFTAPRSTSALAPAYIDTRGYIDISSAPKLLLYSSASPF